MISSMFDTIAGNEALKSFFNSATLEDFRKYKIVKKIAHNAKNVKIIVFFFVVDHANE